jgi:hypothetical protein
MKKIAILLIVLFIAWTMFAQDDEQPASNWKKGGDFTLNFSQLSFSNWSAGGKNSVSGVSLLNYSANYGKDRLNWDNAINLGYGLLKEGSNDLIKSEDKMDLSSKLGYKMSEEGKWLYSGLFNFRSQFANGYKYPDTDNKISALFSPAYITLALGADYKPSDNFSVFLSPLGTKLTIVTDDDLSAIGAFGVDPGKKFRAELGGSLKSELKFPVVENVDVHTVLGLFSNYLHNPQNIDVNWDFRVNMKINEYLSANFITNMIYDHDILITLDEAGNKGRRVQWKQLFGAGLSFKF